MPQRKKYNDNLGPFTALIVEDEPIVALDLELLLSGLGAASVETAARASDARTLLRDSKFDVCLLDYHLEDGTSGSVAKMVMDIEIPFVFMSGDSDFIKKLRDIDHLNVLEKPFSHKDVKLAVARALGVEPPESART